ncbi:MAG TPA: site-specific integrase [Burkholderiaceae bacterium]|nr:site-specific integrase [Burkholderiaceae bacterium]
MNSILNAVCAVPDLTFPSVQFAPAETPWNLDILLYVGGAVAHKSEVNTLVASGKLGGPVAERVQLVCSIHSEINSGLASGGSRATAESLIRYLRVLYSFADSQRLEPSFENIVRIYCAWADSLYMRTLVKGSQGKLKGGLKPLKMASAYSYAATVGGLIDKVLERQSNVVELTKLTHKPRRKAPTSVEADKQNLEHTFIFGHMLQDVCDAFTLGTVLSSPFPIEIKLRTGQRFTRMEARGCQPTEYPQLSGRYHLANLRIEAEMLMFIAQTGMNVSQAVNAELRQFFYVSHLDGYQVKDYKERRGGVVLFEIFKDYKAHFERYLAWRRTLFPNSNFLFPFVSATGTRQDKKFANDRISEVCFKIGITYVPPRTLRNTRVNWLLRKSADPELTAEMAQHTRETLLAVYERPSLQRALVETARFWSATDMQAMMTESVAPGGCNGQAKAMPDSPTDAPAPDCSKASGCLWCENHRDIDSLDYVWALSSYKQLKVVELTKASSPLVNRGVPPPHLAIDRLNAKLRWYEQSNSTRREWVSEAEARIAEGDYHPSFDIEILELEGRV